ncbi:hypothetical protein BC835DRAFT_1419522 [Cytidiella melzeri]|nr:hypothetical protein BC835DRAFT_1419522 [Cytidiella melzeri]
MLASAPHIVTVSAIPYCSTESQYSASSNKHNYKLASRSTGPGNCLSPHLAVRGQTIDGLSARGESPDEKDRQYRAGVHYEFHSRLSWEEFDKLWDNVAVFRERGVGREFLDKEQKRMWDLMDHIPDLKKLGYQVTDPTDSSSYSELLAHLHARGVISI